MERAGLAPDREWVLLKDAAARARTLATGSAARYGVGPDGRLGAPDDPGVAGELHWSGDRWTAPDSGRTSALLELYLPVCAASAERPIVVGHLGQSLDGYIATASGDSDFVTGRENIVHLHRMRALCDAVIVGAATAAEDDPRLTTRLVEGKSPVRVILDPGFRLAERLGVFADGAAPTLVVVSEAARGVRRAGNAEVLTLPLNGERFDLGMLLERLLDRGLCAVFVEGGGRTVSSFLDGQLLDRLHVAVAPMLTGRGRPGLRLPERQSIADCLRPVHRVFRMGQDILFDFDLGARPGAAGSRLANPAAGEPGGLERIS